MKKHSKSKKLKGFKKYLIFSEVSLIALLVCLAIISFVAYSAARLANAASRSNNSIRCTTNYQPVCGTDNKTYSNSCQAGLKGIAVAYEGKCGSKKACQAGETSVICSASKIAWCSSSDKACCPNNDYCVKNGQCYNKTQGSAFTIFNYNNVSANDNVAKCDNGGVWVDLDDIPDQCGNLGWANGAGGPSLILDSRAGESGVGEYSNTNSIECCGDDRNEYVVNNKCPGATESWLCCNNKNDKINAEGKCVASCPNSNKVSNFFQNMWNRIRRK